MTFNELVTKVRGMSYYNNAGLAHCVSPFL